MKQAQKVEPITTLDPIGEVTSSSITSFIVESWSQGQWDEFPESLRPAFGNFLKVKNQQNLQIIGVVFDIVTGPQDSHHRPSALRLTHEQLKLQQPHIFALLRTEIHAVTIGYSIGNDQIHYLPPQPPNIHDFVYPANPAEVRQVTEGFDFLRLISNVSLVPTDELLAACIRRAYQARDNDYDFLVEAGQALSHLYRDDYDRLISVLRKLRSKSGG